MPARSLATDPVRASYRVFSNCVVWGNKQVLTIERGGKNLLWNGARLQNAGSQNLTRNLIYFDALVPADIRPTDVLKLYVLSESGANCFVDDLEVAAMEPVR
jgi:hypothetical protein